MRLFLGIELPEPAIEHINGVRRALRDVAEFDQGLSWVAPENVHITLKFIGEWPAERLEELKSTLAGIPVTSTELLPVGMLYFPRRGPVRVAAVGIEDLGGNLISLHKRIELACRELGIPREQRPLSPHVTLARSRRFAAGDMSRLRETTLERYFPGPHFVVKHATLFQSHLRAPGAKYETLARFEAGPNIS